MTCLISRILYSVAAICTQPHPRTARTQPRLLVSKCCARSAWRVHRQGPRHRPRIPGSPASPPHAPARPAAAALAWQVGSDHRATPEPLAAARRLPPGHHATACAAGEREQGKGAAVLCAGGTHRAALQAPRHEAPAQHSSAAERRPGDSGLGPTLLAHLQAALAPSQREHVHEAVGLLLGLAGLAVQPAVSWGWGGGHVTHGHPWAAEGGGGRWRLRSERAEPSLGRACAPPGARVSPPGPLPAGSDSRNCCTLAATPAPLPDSGGGL
jgi:hypothetical protein